MAWLIVSDPHHQARQRRLSTLLPLLVLSALVGVSVAGCNSGGGGENPPPAPTTGTASGVLVVPPNNAVESEPNNAIAQAQAVSSSQTVAGSAAQTDTGFVIPGAGGAEAEDLYSLTATGSVRITLTIAADDLSANDLDLVLMDSAGNVLDASAGYVSTEDIETGGAGDFVIGISAFSGSSAYVLTMASLGSLASVSSEIAPAGAEFVPDEILVKRKTGPDGTRRKSGAFVESLVTHQQSFQDGVDLVKVIPPQRPLQKAGGPAKLNVPGSADNAMRALTIDTIKKLRVDPSIEYAEPNFIRRASAVPNDQFYGYQWHYQLMNLPQAWDVTTGSNSVIVAVIDTGV